MLIDGFMCERTVLLAVIYYSRETVVRSFVNIDGIAENPGAHFTSVLNKDFNSISAWLAYRMNGVVCGHPFTHQSTLTDEPDGGFFRNGYLEGDTEG